MPSSYTTRLRLEKQADGENANSWGDRLNQHTLRAGARWRRIELVFSQLLNIVTAFLEESV